MPVFRTTDPAWSPEDTERLFAEARSAEDTEVRIRALGILEAHVWGPEIRALLEANAREEDGEIAWASARLLFFRDLRAYWTLPQTLMARTGAPERYCSEYDELTRIAVDIAGIDAACAGRISRPFTYAHPTEGGIWAAFLEREGIHGAPLEELERLHDQLWHDPPQPERDRILAALAALDHPLSRWARLMHQPRDADEDPAARPALRALALAVLKDPRVDALAGEELKEASVEGAVDRALAQGGRAVNHQIALLTLAQVGEAEDYAAIAGFIADAPHEVRGEALFALYALEERSSVGAPRGEILATLEERAQSETDLWARRWAVKLLGRAEGPLVLEKLEALARDPEGAIADAAALALIARDRGRYLDLAKQVLGRTSSSWDHFELQRRAEGP